MYYERVSNEIQTRQCTIQGSKNNYPFGTINNINSPKLSILRKCLSPNLVQRRGRASQETGSTHALMGALSSLAPLVLCSIFMICNIKNKLSTVNNSVYSCTTYTELFTFHHEITTITRHF